MPDSYGEVEVRLRSAKGIINSDLTLGSNVTSASSLKANLGISQQGVILVGEGFRLAENEVSTIVSAEEASRSRVRPYIIGQDITQRRVKRWVIDTYGMSEGTLRANHPHLYQLLLQRVKPERDQNRDRSFRENWWLWGRPRPEIRDLSANLDRVIVTCRTAKHRIFIFEEARTIPDAKVIFVGLNDAFHLGVLSSRTHLVWALRTGAFLEDRPNYNHSDCFGKFPFPADVTEPLKVRIRAEAEALDALRKRVLAEHDDFTLTKLYNVLQALREGRALTDIERDIHDRGLVTLIRQHHVAIDTLVAEAYGWPADLPDEQILTRLVALNKERAAEEKRGLIRWLRPELQAPDYQAPVAGTLNFGEAAVTLPDNVIPWPGTLPEQVRAVQSILSSSPTPLGPQDVARAFKGKRAATVRPVLDALASIGMARRLGNGRFAA